MWMTGRPKTELRVSAEDRATLERWTARRTTAQGLALRSRIVLGCASGLSNIAVARKLGIADQTVCKWRGRFVNKGVRAAGRTPQRGAAQDHRRPGRGDDCQDAGVHAARCDALEHTFDGSRHW